MRQSWIKHTSFSSQATLDWKYQKCERSMIHLEHPFVVQFFSQVNCMVLLQGFVWISTGVCIKYPYIEKCLMTSIPNLPVLMPSLASFDRFLVLPWSSSPGRGNNFGSISVSLQTSDTILAVRSDKSLCLMLTKHFLTADVVLNVEFTSTWTKYWNICDFQTIR